MTRRTLLLAGVSLVLCLNSASKQTRAEIEWSARPIKGNFHQSEPITIDYQIVNRSTSEVWVPRSIDPFMSVRFRFYDPDGHPMSWNGARFTFKYGRSDLVKLIPGEKKSGTFTVPRACPDEKSIEKGGFCFQMRGSYTGTAAFQMGLNAFYHRDEIQGQMAEGPYLSKKFTFAVY